MMHFPTTSSERKILTVLTGTVIATVIVGTLFWARSLLIPIALGVFLTFILTPIITYLERCGLSRMVSITVTLVSTVLLLGIAGYGVYVQISNFSEELPRYSNQVSHKLLGLREFTQGGILENFQGFFDKVSTDLKSDGKSPVEPEGRNPTQPPPWAPAPGDAKDAPSGWFLPPSGFVKEVLDALSTGAMAVLLMVFFVLKREDLRNRFIRLVGHANVTHPTKALDEAAQRISDFLFMQAIINGGYGLIFGLLLFLVGVPYAVVWGFLAAVLRYIPYLGAPLSVLAPLTLSVAISDSWMPFLLVIGIFLVMEMITANVLEPWLFGHSMGVSPVAFLLCVAFWAFLWGPIGMVLASPLTVLVVVLGRYVKSLEFLEVLLGDGSALPADVHVYQRLIAQDPEEALQVTEESSAKMDDMAEVYDTVLMPSLNYLRRDRDLEHLEEDDEKHVLSAMTNVLTQLEKKIKREAPTLTSEPPKPGDTLVQLMLCSARDEADSVGVEMLRHLLNPARWLIEVAPVETLGGELMELVAEQQPSIVCIGALATGGLQHCRYLCKRLRIRFPEMKIIVGFWGIDDESRKMNAEKVLKDAGADVTAWTLQETRDQLESWLPVYEQAQAQLKQEVAV